MHCDRRPIKGRKPRVADDIIEAITLIIVERKSSNYQRFKQAIAQSEQLKWALKTFESPVNTLITTCTKDEEGMTTRHARVATTL